MPIKPRACQRCQAMIPLERLEALPETRLCVRCSQDIGGEFEYRAVPENIGKAGSLKKNYGSFDIRKRRKPIKRLEN
jgi:hypothetical protein